MIIKICLATRACATSSMLPDAVVRSLIGDARVRDVIIVVREDEAQHRDVNHQFADQLARRQT